MKHMILEHTWEEGEPLLIGYLPAGYPDRKHFSEAVRCCANQGLAFLEVGIPAQDPYLDGKIISEAMAKIGVAEEELPYLIAETLQETTNAGIHSIAMLYNETLEAIGIRQFAAICEEGRASAVLVPNITEHNRELLYEALRGSTVETISFIAYEAEEQEIRNILRYTTGFIYLQSMGGSTGGKFVATKEAKQRLDTVKKLAEPYHLPVALGFGISTPEAVAEAAEIGADAAIIGTAFVKAAGKGVEHIDPFLEQFAPYLKKKEEETWTI